MLGDFSRAAHVRHVEPVVPDPEPLAIPLVRRGGQDDMLDGPATVRRTPPVTHKAILPQAQIRRVTRAYVLRATVWLR
jgi:hypothetical protein